MHTVLIDNATNTIAFAQSGRADHKAMERDAASSGIGDYQILELSDPEYQDRLASQIEAEPPSSGEGATLESLAKEVAAMKAALIAKSVVSQTDIDTASAFDFK